MWVIQRRDGSARLQEILLSTNGDDACGPDRETPEVCSSYTLMFPLPFDICHLNPLLERGVLEGFSVGVGR